MPESFTLEISRVDIGKLDVVWGIINTCSEWLAAQGLVHWAQHYTPEMMAKMIGHKEVYLATVDGVPQSTVTIDTRPPKYYETDGYVSRFTDPEASAMYLMALGVLPEFQRRGIAVKLVQFAESEAKKRGAKWMRLDCRVEVPKLVSFYENRGFKKVGEPIVEGENESYMLMEKKLI